MAVVRNLVVRAGADFSSLRNEMKKAQKNISEFKSGVQGAMRGAALAIGSVGFGALAADATRTAMDVEAAMQQINRLMGDNAHAFREWSKDTAGAFNMSEANAIKYGAIFGNLLSTFSSGAEDTKNKTIDILQASAVTASATGRTMEDVMWRIRSGLLGNTEAIEDLGINVYVNMLKTTEAFRMFAGDKSWDQLDFQTQQLIRYYGILEQANKKFGAEINQNTNSALQAFQASLGNVRLALGQAFLPIMNAVLPALTAMANALASVMRTFAAFTRALFGYKDPAKNVVKSSSKVGGAMAGMADGYEAAGDSAEKSAKKQKKARQILAGFDEINKIGDSADDSDSGSGGKKKGAGGGAPFVDIPLPDPGDASAMGEISKKVKDFADKVRGIFTGLKNFLQEKKDLIVSVMAGLVTALGGGLIVKHWSSIVKFFKTAFATIAKHARIFWAALTGPAGLAVAAISVLVGAFVYFYRTNETFKGVVDGILNGIKDAAVNLWNAMKPVGAWLKDVFVKAWEGLTVAGTWLWKNVMVPMGEFFKKLNKDSLQPLGKTLKDYLHTTISNLSKLASSFWKNVMVPLGDFFKKNLKPTVEALSAVFGAMWKEAIVPLAKIIGGTLYFAFLGLSTVVQILWKNVFKPLSSFMTSVMNVAFQSMGGAIKGLSQMFGGLMNFITGVFTGNWRKAWAGVREIFKGAFTGLVGILRPAMNGIIALVNRGIRGINSISVSIPDWVPRYGGQRIGFNIPNLPYLAQGGYVGKNNPMLAVIGDNRNEGEIVAPESKLYEQTYKAISDALGGGGKGQELVINIAGMNVYRGLIDGINNAQRQAGKTLLNI